MNEPAPQPTPPPFDQETEMKKQTQLLNSINGKLGFFVFIMVAYIIILVLGFFMSV